MCITCTSVHNFCYRLFVCITVGDSIIKMDMVHISLTSLNPSHFYACPKPWLVVFLVCSVSSFKMDGIVRCVDIGGIVDHHCLKFSFHNSDTNLSIVKICISWIFRIIKLQKSIDLLRINKIDKLFETSKNTM